MLVVVGGHSRNIGKTSVVEALIRATSDLNWTAIKITQYGHGVCSSVGESCGCSIEPDHPYALTEEQSDDTSTDTSRFLAAGAVRSYWARTAVGQLGHAMSAIQRILSQAVNAIVESNSIMQFVKPDVMLMVLDFATEDFKPSSLRYLDRANAFAVISTSLTEPLWKGVAARLWMDKPRFTIAPPRWTTPEMTELVRRHSLTAARS